MKHICSLLLLVFMTLAQAESEDMSPFDLRVQLAKEAETDERYKPYPSLLYKRAGKHLARTMRSCIATSPPPQEKTFVLVADINSRGMASAIAVQPENEVAKCFANGFSSFLYPQPPVYARRPGFPITVKIQLQP